MRRYFKSDAELLQELLEDNGYKVTPAHGWDLYMCISDGETRIWADIAPSPDDDNQTDALFFGTDARSDGYYVCWNTHYPDNEQCEILRAVENALADERKYIAMLSEIEYPEDYVYYYERGRIL